MDRNDRRDACERTAKTVWELARQHGWDIYGGDYKAATPADVLVVAHHAETGSYYVEATRWGINSDGEDDSESIKIRISDHPTAHCSEGLSLVVGDASGPDDDNLMILAERLSRPFCGYADSPNP